MNFLPVQRSLNDPELRKDFEEFARRMHSKWNFQNEPSEDFSDKPAFCPKSSWKPHHPDLELLLSQIEKYILNTLLRILHL